MNKVVAKQALLKQYWARFLARKRRKNKKLL